MTSWLLSIVGIIFLGILLDIVYPNGKTNAFCKGIFGIFAVVVMISPILKFDYSKLNNNIYIDNSLITNVANAKADYYQRKIEQVLLDNNINGVTVEIQGKISNYEFEIENIYLDTSELVLTENISNINKYEIIIQIVLKAIDVDKERIVVYG